MTQERIGYIKVSLIIFGIIIIGSIWLSYNISTPNLPKNLTQKKAAKKLQKSLIQFQQNWKPLIDNIVRDFQGKIVSIELLDSTTCWAVLSPNLPRLQTIELAENIGSYIRRSTESTHRITPDVHVFLRGQHVAVARPSGKSYIGEISIQYWNPSAFKGQYRP